MKKAITFLFIALCVFSLSAQNNGKEKAGVTIISEKEFVAKIFDYNDSTARYKGKTPIVVDFYADWCGPCRKLGAIMDDVAKKYDGKVIFYKINVDNNKNIARAFSVQSIPTVLYIKAKEKPARSVGLLDKSKLIEIIDEFLLQ